MKHTVTVKQTRTVTLTLEGSEDLARRKALKKMVDYENFNDENLGAPEITEVKRAADDAKLDEDEWEFEDMKEEGEDMTEESEDDE